MFKVWTRHVKGQIVASKKRVNSGKKYFTWSLFCCKSPRRRRDTPPFARQSASPAWTYSRTLPALAWGPEKWKTCLIPETFSWRPNSAWKYKSISNGAGVFLCVYVLSDVRGYEMYLSFGKETAMFKIKPRKVQKKSAACVFSTLKILVRHVNASRWLCAKYGCWLLYPIKQCH